MIAKPPDTVLVTGAGGFVGKVVARRLSAEGYRVRACSRHPEMLTDVEGERARMPAPDAAPQAWEELIAGADHVVHCAAIADASANIPYSAYLAANADLTAGLAHTAFRKTSGRFVFLSSIRAVTGAVSATTVTEDTAPAPDDDYGRSKLEAERRLARIFAADDGSKRLVTLRPVLVYGDEARGSLAALSRLAALPLPLPLAGLDAPRSLVDVERLADAVLHALTEPAAAGGTYLVCDRHPLSVAGIVAAMRLASGRSPGLFTLPACLIAGLFALAGRRGMWSRLSGPLAASSARLEATGWRAADDTSRRLAAYAASWRDNR